MLRRAPAAPLRPFVETLWLSDAPALGPREIVLPTGAMHVVVRLSDTPLVVYDSLDDPTGRELGCAVVGGARTTAYVRDMSRPTRAVGASLWPGAAELLFGVPADALAGRHTRLDALWGAFTRELRDRVRAAATPADQLDEFERLLTSRLHRGGGVHPAVGYALERLRHGDPVAAVVGATGYSHRAFNALFLRAVGLTPKRWGRVQRLSRALAQPAETPWTEVAHAAGYSDQAHLTREFRAMAGITPGRWRAAAPSEPRHVLVKNVQDGGRAGGRG
ncbi:MAG: AraC family transcriptional regulator [Deltaproteobacteria bacterium]|nr:AraC family transcriptional regulator [Myxococcales bacterium]MDP3215237.1 AraC family transcriptional regulator [Deltaproteobacteria bacterium]